jgi:hypothetical protein
VLWSGAEDLSPIGTQLEDVFLVAPS